MEISKVVADVQPTPRPANVLSIEAQALNVGQVEVGESSQTNEGRALSITKVNQTLAFNDLISIVNLTEDLTKEFEKLGSDLASNATRALGEEIGSVKLAQLEEEANVIVKDINDRVGPGKLPPRGDADETARFEIEQRIGRTLDYILPDGAEGAFGVKRVEYPSKEAIIGTIARVESARNRIQSLRNAVNETRTSLSKEVSTLEIARQNQISANPSPEEVEGFFTLARRTSKEIGRNPKESLTVASSGLGERAMKLLQI
jgi:hypothetical protein